MKPIIILLLSLLPFGAFAGEPAPASAAGEPTVAELSAQLEALKARTSTWDKIAARLPRISGYVQTGYEWSETSSTFFIKRVRLNLAGDIAEKLDYRVQIEFCGPKIVDAYIRYRPFEQLNFQLGEYKLPFSIENTDYVPLKYEFIEYPLSLRRLMGFNDVCGLSATGRDMGAMLYGGFFNRKGYSVLGYNFGEYGSDYLKRVRYGAGACYDEGPLVVRAEWICGTTGLPAGGELDSDGWYAVGGWRVTPSLMSVVRYDTFLENSSESASRQTNYTAGVVWQPVKYLRCQLNYTYEDYASRAAANRNVVSLMLSGIF